MTKRQTKFRYRDVNDAERKPNRFAILGQQVRNSWPRRARLPKTETKSVQQLSWRGLAVRKNVSNRRRKFLDARAGHDDAVTAAVSFLGDAQESSALVLPELDVEMLALNLQFFRFDDVVHFALRARV